VRWTCDNPETERGQEIVQINLYGPARAASVLEEGRVAALGHAPVRLPAGESITVDFGYVRFPLGALIEWGEDYGTDFSVHLSDDGISFREVGRISTGDGGTDSFWWRSTSSRYFRLTVHEASSPDGAVVNELKLRIRGVHTSTAQLEADIRAFIDRHNQNPRPYKWTKSRR
jgi:hypothetical protein